MARGATTVCLMACAIMVLATSVAGSDIAATVSSSGYSPRECPSGKGLSSKGRCVPIRDPTIESVEAKVYQATFTDDSCDESEEDLIPIVGTGPAARKASASKAAAAAAKTAGAKYSRKTYAPATLPDGAVVAKVVFKVDTSSAPKGATGVRCVVTSDDDVKNKLADLPDGLSAFYSLRTSRCYSCGGRKQPRLTKVTEDTCAYSPVDCLARCSKSDEVGTYTVVVESRLRRNAEQTIGTAWMTLPSDIVDLAGLCGYTFPGQYGRNWVIAPPSEPEP